jgi:hypothetical protein
VQKVDFRLSRPAGSATLADAAGRVLPEESMSIKVLVAFYSRNGAVESLAKAVADGAVMEGAELRLRRAHEFVSAEVMAKAPG